MRNLILGSIGVTLLAAACAPPEAVVADTSGRSAAAFPAKDFVARVVGDSEDVWTAQFRAMGRRYAPPKVVLFKDTFPSACGIVRATTGPYYCPADQQVYVDTAFIEDFRSRHRAGGDFVAAYVIVYAVGHHVQHQLGTLQKLEQSADPMDASQRVAPSVRLNLQADCHTGVWTHFVHKRNLLDPGDLEFGAPAAQALGDTFTRGTPAQRAWWFKQGLATGDSRACDRVTAFQP